MDIYEALYTTRSMRRVKPDPIPEEVQARILDAAIRAPSGGDQQRWRFLLVDDAGVKAQLGPLYRECLAGLWASAYAAGIAAAAADPESEQSRHMARIKGSADHLAEHFEAYPLLLFGFAQDKTGASIYPAVWNAMLAARAEGVGSTLTTILWNKTEEAFGILGVPSDEGWHMACCVPFGYPTGRWGVAARRPATEVSYRNRWGQDVGLDLDRPLWPARTGSSGQ